MAAMTGSQFFQGFRHVGHRQLYSQGSAAGDYERLPLGGKPDRGHLSDSLAELLYESGIDMAQGPLPHLGEYLIGELDRPRNHQQALPSHPVNPP